MCGIIGVFNHLQASKKVFLGLYALQHRGEEAAGIASFDGKEIRLVKNRGLVADALTPQTLESLPGRCAIGHCRYSTTGSSNTKNIQPFLVVHKGMPIAIAHNGNLTNTGELFKRLEDDGALFQTSMDSELIVHLLAREKAADIPTMFVNVLRQLRGAFSLIFLVGDKVVGARDPQGFRPLCLGRMDGAYVLASETCALDLVEAEFIREIEPGELVVIDGDRLQSYHYASSPAAHSAHCIFENVYFARPDSRIFGDTVYFVRKRLGAQLAKECPADGADLVMSIPDSGNYAALGYAQQAGIPFESGMIRNHYIGRTFIQPTQFIREARVRVKLNPIRDVLAGKKVVVVEDSIVRGTTSRSRIQEIRRAGAKEIHMRISCPPIQWPCFYGIDFPNREDLIAARHSVSEIAGFIGVDSLGYLSREGMLSVMAQPENFCHACFSGEYPVAVDTAQHKCLLEN